MKYSFLFALALGATSLFASCSKKDDPSKSEQIAGKKWTATAIQGQQSGQTVDLYATLKPCEKDDFLLFNSNKTLTADEGATTCTPGDAQTQVGSWELVTNDTKLMLTTPMFGSGTAVLFDIVELSDKTMTLRGSMPDDTGQLVTVTASFRAN